jgi:hypothetical protein
VFLKSAGKYLCVENAKATSETSLSFMLPVAQLANADKDDNTFDVVVNDDADGTIALRDALVMNGLAPDSLHANECVVAVANNLHYRLCFPVSRNIVRIDSQHVLSCADVVQYVTGVNCFVSL